MADLPLSPTRKGERYKRGSLEQLIYSLRRLGLEVELLAGVAGSLPGDHRMMMSLLRLFSVRLIWVLTGLIPLLSMGWATLKRLLPGPSRAVPGAPTFLPNARWYGMSKAMSQGRFAAARGGGQPETAPDRCD